LKTGVCAVMDICVVKRNVSDKAVENINYECNVKISLSPYIVSLSKYVQIIVEWGKQQTAI
jgi:hypothetical protein